MLSNKMSTAKIHVLKVSLVREVPKIIHTIVNCFRVLSTLKLFHDKLPFFVWYYIRNILIALFAQVYFYYVHVHS
jgi:hypothetical protein